jgi:hypothetical protein
VSSGRRFLASATRDQNWTEDRAPDFQGFVHRQAHAVPSGRLIAVPLLQMVIATKERNRRLAGLN